jgi:hypothetical protein
MADPNNLSGARLLVRADLSGVRLDALLRTGPVGGRTRPAQGASPEAPTNGRLQAGVVYANHASPGTWTWIPRWQLGEGDALQLVFRYWGPGGTPPESATGLTAFGVGEIEGHLEEGPAPAADGPATPTRVLPELTQVVLRYRVALEGSATPVVRELALGRLRTPLVAPSGCRLLLPLRTQQDAEIVYAALNAPGTTLVLRAEVPAWVRSWNQTVVGTRAPLRDAGVIAKLVPTREFSAMKLDPQVIASTRTLSTVKIHIPVAPEPVAEPVAAEPVAIKPVLAHLNLSSTLVSSLAHRVSLTPKPVTIAKPVGIKPITLAQPVTIAKPVALTIAKPVTTSATVLKTTLHPEALAATRVLRIAKPVGEAPAAVIDASVVAKVAKLNIGGRLLAPSRAIVDPDGEPAWVQTTLPVEWELPFSFPIAAEYSHLYETGTLGLTGAPSILRPIVVTDSTGQPIRGVYQEVVVPTRIHLVPQVFRLSRAPDAPGLPELRMVAGDFVAATDEGVEPVYRVSITYALEPWISPDVRDAVSRALGRPAPELSFSITPPVLATLRLTLPDGPSERSGATLDANARITDVLDLSPDAFSHFVRTLRDSPASGITGSVSVRLLDGQETAESAVHLALGFESENLLDTVVRGVVEPGRWRVELRNRIESPVRIEECRAFAFAGGVAAPVADTAPIGTELRPGESLTVDYLVTPADAAFVVETAPVRATPRPDAESLLRMLVLSSGGTAETVTVDVSGRFPPPGDPAFATDPLVALRVEFDDESAVTLTSGTPDARVTLAGRLLDVALGRAVRRYFFRVQNINTSGPGAASGWLARDVGVKLDVPWVVATLPDAF